MGYIVVFRYTKKAKGHHGVVTWSSYSNKEEFKKLFTDEQKEFQEVVEEGVSQEDAIRLTKTTPAACRIAAAFEKSKDLDGTLNPEILKMEMMNTMLSIADDTKIE